MGLKEFNQQHEISSINIVSNTHFLRRNPDLHKVFIETMKEMAEHNITNKVATLYLMETEPLLKGKSFNTVRRWFRDIKDGLV